MSIVDPVILFTIPPPILPLTVDGNELFDDWVVDVADVEDIVVDGVAVGVVVLVTLETIEKLLRLIS